MLLARTRQLLPALLLLLLPLHVLLTAACYLQLATASAVISSAAVMLQLLVLMPLGRSTVGISAGPLLLLMHIILLTAVAAAGAAAVLATLAALAAATEDCAFLLVLATK